jgi:hypothetical protein
MKIIHYSHLGKIKSPVDFLFSRSEGAVNICHHPEGERLVFGILDSWACFSRWVCYGVAYYMDIDPCTIVSVGIGGCYHQVCKLKDVDVVALNLDISENLLGLNLESLLLASPISSIPKDIDVDFQ